MGRRPTSVLPACWWFPGDLTPPKPRSSEPPEQHTQQTRWAGCCRPPLPPATSRTSLEDGLSVMTQWFCALTPGAPAASLPHPPPQHPCMDSWTLRRQTVSSFPRVGRSFPRGRSETRRRVCAQTPQVRSSAQQARPLQRPVPRSRSRGHPHPACLATSERLTEPSLMKFARPAPGG